MSKLPQYATESLKALQTKRNKLRRDGILRSWGDEPPLRAPAWSFSATFASMNSHMTSQPEMRPVDHRLVRLDLLIHGAFLGLSVIILTQLLQLKVSDLDCKLWTSILCFAASIPLLSMTFLARTVESTVDRAPKKGFWLVWLSRSGLVVTFVGIATVFLHFCFAAFALFFLASVVSLLVGVNYYNQASSEPGATE